MEKSLLIFEKYVKSEATKITYVHYFNSFLKWSQNNIKNLTADGLLQLKDNFLQELVEDYVLYLRKRLSPNSIPGIIASLELFFSMKDKNIQFKKIRRMLPTTVKKSGKEAWSTGDIQKMLRNTVSKRDRALVHFLASTGCRIGALQDMKLKHISEMSDRCKSVVFYADSNEEYSGFLTPEACDALEEYLESRRKDGEVICSDSPVFRSSYQLGVQKARPLSTASAKMMTLRLASTVDRNKQGNRYSVMAAHGFRKRFNTTLKSNDSANQALCEKLMGHRGVFHLDGSYLTPTIEQLFLEFKKHIQNLTVDDSERNKMKIAELEADLSEKVKLEDEIQRQRQAIEYLLRKDPDAGKILSMYSR